jgi:hypothetical protein
MLGYIRLVQVRTCYVRLALVSLGSDWLRQVISGHVRFGHFRSGLVRM